jgi:hypothetical protein
MNDVQNAIDQLVTLRLGPRALGDEHRPLRWRAEHEIERAFLRELAAETARLAARRGVTV